MKIKELSTNERPRERMLSRGAGSLSNAELIAILLRTGTKGESALEMGQRLLSLSNGSLSELSSIPLGRLRSINGFGGMKVLPLMAAFELGRRFVGERNRQAGECISSPKQVYDMLIPEMKGLKREECWALFLNRANMVLEMKKLSIGGLCATVFDIKEIMSIALEKKASGIILSHNHPSGNPRPGIEDTKQTAALKQAALSFDISLIDHVIVCDDCFYSFADESVYSAVALTIPCGDAP